LSLIGSWAESKLDVMQSPVPVSLAMLLLDVVVVVDGAVLFLSFSY
jgi:hypothetical protein